MGDPHADEAAVRGVPARLAVRDVERVGKRADDL
jgi:hypothetical protein